MTAVKTIIAYRIFINLKYTPVKCKEYADKFNVNISTLKNAAADLSRLGLVKNRKGNVKMTGLAKIPNLTAEDFFEKYEIAPEDIGAFKKNVKNFFSKKPEKPKKVHKCQVCSIAMERASQTGFCEFCNNLDKPLNEVTKLARCGHPSANRYFNCNNCVPVLEHNDTEYDLSF